MDDTDDFLLDGERLIPCAVQQRQGVSCQAGGTHSTERETYARIVRQGDRWTVWDSTGTSSSYVSWPGRAQNALFGLAERRNTHGDVVTFHRWCDGDDACYLRAIEYADADDAAKHTRVELRYERRPDPVTIGMGKHTLTSRYGY